MTDQLDLFGTPPTPTGRPAPGRQCPPVRQRGQRSTAGNPAVTVDVLAEVHEGRYGLLDDTDRVVVFEDSDRVRMALDEDAVHQLLAQGYAQRRPLYDTVSCYHGVVRRPVLGLRLTKRGRSLLARWSALRPLD
ncbi:hypothetical protein [Amycolatopsis sp. 195334CR]|uniref:hypothetical protein n=1 Tax=Amycolatopsis sp. 195334CR TaxID=2814588 RepID=UPI001A8D428A|nr:hypothetical protein [Amycolatopsis sp. 195334CR]MBN6039122.1 hypothetical protein [Amycolatopsis sp. 195334CR]